MECIFLNKKLAFWNEISNFAATVPATPLLESVPRQDFVFYAESHRFAPNSSFTFATNLYVFDRELRSLIFTAIQDIESAAEGKAKSA